MNSKAFSVVLPVIGSTLLAAGLLRLSFDVFGSYQSTDTSSGYSTTYHIGWMAIVLSLTGCLLLFLRYRKPM